MDVKTFLETISMFILAGILLTVIVQMVIPKKRKAQSKAEGQESEDDIANCTVSSPYREVWKEKQEELIQCFHELGENAVSATLLSYLAAMTQILIALAHAHTRAKPRSVNWLIPTFTIEEGDKDTITLTFVEGLEEPIYFKVSFDTVKGLTVHYHNDRGELLSIPLYENLCELAYLITCKLNANYDKQHRFTSGRIINRDRKRAVENGR